MTLPPKKRQLLEVYVDKGVIFSSNGTVLGVVVGASDVILMGKDDAYNLLHDTFVP